MERDFEIFNFLTLSSFQLIIYLPVDVTDQISIINKHDL
jgi:hypothetical protein